MIPLKDMSPRRSVPWMTLLIIAANAAVFFHQISLGPHAADMFIKTYGLMPSKIQMALAGSSTLAPPNAGFPLPAPLPPRSNSRCSPSGSRASLPAPPPLDVPANTQTLLSCPRKSIAKVPLPPPPDFLRFPEPPKPAASLPNTLADIACGRVATRSRCAACTGRPPTQNTSVHHKQDPRNPDVVRK